MSLQRRGLVLAGLSTPSLAFADCARESGIP